MKKQFFLLTIIPILYVCLVSSTCSKTTGEVGVPSTPPIDTPAPPPNPSKADLCNNLIKDSNEDGIDCGGICAPCHNVVVEKELLIRHTEIVDNEAAITGDLSFGNLMERLTPSSTNTKDLVLSLIKTWEQNQTVNGANILARPAVTKTITDLWKQNASEATSTQDATFSFDMDKAPFRLLAITNRIDLNNADSGGEGRLTFGLSDTGSNIFTLIFEYNLKIDSPQDVIRWAKKWHGLSNMDKTSDEYLASVVGIVNDFTQDGSHLNQIRTNEVIGGIADNSFKWELREFNLVNDAFQEVTRKQSPSQDLDNTVALKEYLEDATHRAEILAGDHSIKNDFNTRPFMSGQTLYDGNFTWQAPNMDADAVELQFLTEVSCTGCHGGLVPNTNFTHIKPRSFGSEAQVSTFLLVDAELRRDIIGDILQLPLDDMIVIDSPRSIDIEPSQVADIKDLIARLNKRKRVH